MKCYLNDEDFVAALRRVQALPDMNPYRDVVAWAAKRIEELNAEIGRLTTP